MAKINKTFVLNDSEIEKIEFGVFKLSFTLRKKIAELTMADVPYILKLATLGLIILFSPFFPKITLQVRLDDEFKNEEAFRNLLEKNKNA